MTTRNVVLTPHQHKLDALRRAADIGWADLSSGSYVDIDDADLETYVSHLGNAVD